MNRRLRATAHMALAASLVAGSSPSAAHAAASPDRSFTVVEQGSFEAGGTAARNAEGASISCDHGHVEYQIPRKAKSVAMFLWHSSSAAVWQRRWDGGEGFQTKLLRRGYSTYVWDGPRVGRANWGCESYTYQAEAGRDQSSFLAWRLGPAYPQFFPGVQFPTNDAAALDQAARARYAEFDTVTNARLEAAAAAKALDRIGPSVLLTNSAGGMRALLAALETDKIRAIVAYENPGFVFPRSAGINLPEGPFGPVYVSDAEFARLTKVPMQFVWGDNVEKSASWRQLLDQCRQFVRIVNERGGKAEILMLPDAGLKGNTHIPFADMNNEDVAAQLFAWLKQQKLDR